NRSNYISIGNSIQTGWGSTKLKDQDASFWSDITNMFNGWDGDYLRVLITPGTVTNETGSYQGMGALLVGRDMQGWQAPISGPAGPVHGGSGILQPVFDSPAGSTTLSWLQEISPSGG